MEICAERKIGRGKKNKYCESVNYSHKTHAIDNQLSTHTSEGYGTGHMLPK